MCIRDSHEAGSEPGRKSRQARVEGLAGQKTVEQDLPVPFRHHFGQEKGLEENGAETDRILDDPAVMGQSGRDEENIAGPTPRLLPARGDTEATAEKDAEFAACLLYTSRCV